MRSDLYVPVLNRVVSVVGQDFAGFDVTAADIGDGAALKFPCGTYAFIEDLRGHFKALRDRNTIHYTADDGSEAVRLKEISAEKLCPCCGYKTQGLQSADGTPEALHGLNVRVSDDYRELVDILKGKPELGTDPEPETVLTAESVWQTFRDGGDLEAIASYLSDGTHCVEDVLKFALQESTKESTETIWNRFGGDVERLLERMEPPSELASNEAYLNLLRLGKIGPEWTDKNGRTPLHYAALTGNSRGVAEMIELGVSVDHATPDDVKGRDGETLPNQSKVTALLNASENASVEKVGKGHEEVALLLLENGADPNATNKVGISPLMYAAVNGNKRLVEEMMRSGDKHPAGDKALFFDAGEGGHWTAKRYAEFGKTKLLEAGAEIAAERVLAFDRCIELLA